MSRPKILTTWLRATLALALCASSLSGSGLDETHPGQSSQSLDVLCIEADAKPLPGTTLRMCPEELIGQPHDVLQSECVFAVADADGRARFEGLETRKYVLHAQLDGFADTAVGPLGIGSKNPQPPSEVVVLLNPVCWGC